MVTLFTTPKPFLGHSNTIQRNALESWTLLGSDVEVILFGDEEGAAEAAVELGIRQVPRVDRTLEGTKYIRSFFDPANRIARHNVLCYVNCDIILTPDFLSALGLVSRSFEKFLMVGRRWDADICEPLPFRQPDWANDLHDLARSKGRQASSAWIDYFAFSKDLYLGQIPDFVIGRVFWDNWLVWKARRAGAAVVDASEAVMAIHQNHDYSYHSAGRNGVWSDHQAMRNLTLAGGRWHLCTIDDATHKLDAPGIRLNPDRRAQNLRRFFRAARETLWLGALGWSRPFRAAIGLRKKNLDAVYARLRRSMR